MTEQEWLAGRFEEHRGHLRAVAYRMLGSTAEADDAVQEAWLRASRAGADGVENVGGWLTTIVARVALDALRSRTSRREEPIDALPIETLERRDTAADPEHDAVRADEVGGALLVVLDLLTPAERVAFVLHDMFAVPFEEIAPIIDRTPVAARQLASRARKRVQGASGAGADDPPRRRAIVDAFLAAAREGHFAGLMSLLDPNAVMRADAAAIQMGGPPEFVGATAIAERVSGGARVLRMALLDGEPGAVWMTGKEIRVAFAFSIAGGVIVGIDLISDPGRLAAMSVELLAG
jgi:RNA polymerase sigma-70 factor (ECF subfamily)